VRQREAVRRRVDERFDPAKAIEATARYLDFAKGKLGRDDLAVVSYHMGVGNLQQALMAYGKGVVPYASCTSTRARCATRRRGASWPRWATTRRPTCGVCSRPATSCACTGPIPGAPA
jgi:soluble lytic murein transglycosylase-like protein